MCGAYPEIGNWISLAMQWQFNEGIVCVTYGDAVILMTAHDQTHLTINEVGGKIVCYHCGHTI